MRRHFKNMFDLYLQSDTGVVDANVNWVAGIYQTSNDSKEHRALVQEMTKFPNKFIGWFRWAIDCAGHRLPCGGFLTSFRSGRSSSSCCSKLVDDFSGKGSMA